NCLKTRRSPNQLHCASAFSSNPRISKTIHSKKSAESRQSGTTDRMRPTARTTTMNLETLESLTKMSTLLPWSLNVPKLHQSQRKHQLHMSNMNSLFQIPRLSNNYIPPSPATPIHPHLLRR